MKSFMAGKADTMSSTSRKPSTPANTHELVKRDCGVENSQTSTTKYKASDNAQKTLKSSSPPENLRCLSIKEYPTLRAMCFTLPCADPTHAAAEDSCLRTDRCLVVDMEVNKAMVIHEGSEYASLKPDWRLRSRQMRSIVELVASQDADNKAKGSERELKGGFVMDYGEENGLGGTTATQSKGNIKIEAQKPKAAAATVSTTEGDDDEEDWEAVVVDDEVADSEYVFVGKGGR